LRNIPDYSIQHSLHPLWDGYDSAAGEAGQKAGGGKDPAGTGPNVKEAGILARALARHGVMITHLAGGYQAKRVTAPT
jgi:hypothetical protein